jgi:transcriptional regulator with XRE-family HTH domain
MSGVEAFGASLRALLQARGRTTVDLAESLHVDPSLVRRWLRGERVPALGSRHVERIAVALGLSDVDRRRLESAQIARLRVVGERGGSTSPAISNGPLLPTVGVGEDVCLLAEERPGERRLVAEGLGDNVLPAAWLDRPAHWARATGLDEGAVGRLLAAQRRRLAAFEAQVEAYSFRQICSKWAVESFAREGVRVRGPLFQTGLLQLAPAERAELLWRAAELLESHPRFEIAAVDEGDDVPPPNTGWAVKGDHTVALWPGRPDDAPVWIAEPAVVAAFRDHFDDLWGRISPHRRARRLVVRWLRELAAAVGG